MSREIKFRAWLHHEKYMYPVSVFYSPDNGVKGKQIELQGKPVMRAYTIGEDVDVMQYTGLLDGSGNEIYEGDIVRLEGAALATVTYAHGAYRYEGGGQITALQDITTEWVEVIGNIYEHSELMRKP